MDSLTSGTLDLVCNGRLTLESGVPISTSDQLAKTTLYWTPYKGNRMDLYTGSVWERKTSAEISIAVPSEVFRIYDVYAYNNAGTVALELTAWDSGGQTTGAITGCTNATPIVVTSAGHGRSIGDLVGINGTITNTAPNGKIWYLSNTTTTFTLEGSVGNGASASGGTWYLIPTARTTALTLQDGVYVKNGATTRRYLGTIMTTPTSGQCEDSVKRRFVWNNYNRVVRPMLAVDPTDTWNYSTATLRAANNNTDLGVAQFACVIGLKENPVKVNRLALTTQATNLAQTYAQIGVNRTAVSVTTGLAGGATAVNGFQQQNAYYTGFLPLGFSFIQALEISTATTTTWYGDAGSSGGQIQLGMSAEIFA
jgi:hypothetical protein